MLTKIRVSVSRTCEMSCIYCPRGPKINMENYDGLESYCMTTDEIIRILRVMRQFGLENVHLTGGEPLRRGDLISLIELINLMGMKVQLNTNGMGLTSSKVHQLKDAGVELLKISLDAPNRSSFLTFTGVDAFDRVISGIRMTVCRLPVRLNCVVMRSNLSDIIPLLDKCNEMGVSEVHLLDLTYYPCLGGKTFWEREFVYLTKELQPILEEHYGNHFEVMSIYGCRFYRMPTVTDGTAVVLKEAEPTMRALCCEQCDEYCHEGVFTLRLSAGGYLNFCPCSNKFGVNALRLLEKDRLRETLAEYSAIFGQAVSKDSFATFLERNSLVYRGKR